MPEYKCSSCEYKSEYKTHVKDHINRKKKCGDGILEIIEIKLDFMCEFCKKTFSNRTNLTRHIKTCKARKINLEKELIIKTEKIKEIKNELTKNAKQYLEDKNYLQKKYDDLESNIINLIDKKVLGNTNVETIRSQARKKYKDFFKDISCVNCKHTGSTQICHIKAISEFNKLSTVEEINHISNLVGLCPNCHIDLDKHKKFKVVRTSILYSFIVNHMIKVKN